MQPPFLKVNRFSELIAHPAMGRKRAVVLADLT
jgi:hypothetical protein